MLPSMRADALTEAVLRFAVANHGLPETVLDSDAYAWDEYEGVRYAFLHTTMALRGLAGRLHEERFRSNCPVTLAQHALAEHHAAFRDFQSLLLGVPDALITTVPKPDEWPIRNVLLHVHETERYFFAAIMNALDESEMHEPTEAEAAAIVGEPETLPSELPLAELWANFERTHDLIVDRLEGLTDDELTTPATMWEHRPMPILFRMQRFAAHLREHTNQLEKTLHWLGHAPNEARLLLRQMLAALAEVEGVRFGMGEMGQVVCDKLAVELEARLTDLRDALAQNEMMLSAVRTNDVAAAKTLLHARPALARTIMEDGLSAVLYSHYRGHSEMVDALLASGMRLPMAESAALGELVRVRRILEYSKEYANSMARDGFAVLQLACYFAHPDVVQLLLENGADVHTVSRNSSQLQAIHSAVAGRNAAAVKLLIDAGADVNARQQGGFTPLMAAVQNGDAEIEALLRTAGVQE